MIYGMYLSATGMAGEQARQDLIANNLANVETNGFKRVLSLFQERPPQPGAPAWRNMTGGRWTLPTQLDLTQGGLEPSDSPLDMAILGDGYLTVRKGQDLRLTRDGRLAVNARGQLSLASDPNVLVLSGEGQPILLGDTPVQNLRIDADGTLRDTATGGILATLRLSTAQSLIPVGGNLLSPVGPIRPAANAEIRGGHVERSNVDPTLELTRLIDAGRLLEANANMIRYQDTSLGRMIEASRVG